MSDGGERRRLILGVDPGSACGWAVVSFPEGVVVQHGTWKLQHSRLEGGGMMFVRLESWLKEVLWLDLDLLAMEEVKRHKGTDAAHLYGGITAIITRVCEWREITYTGIGVGTWKKLVVGKGNASKEDVMQAAIHRWPNTSFTQDEADAACIALAVGAQLGWLEEEE